MKWLFFIALSIMAPIFLMAQDKYGFGFIVVTKFSSDNSMVSKHIFVSRVVNLDSIGCNKYSGLKTSMRKNRIYFDCVGEWFMRNIEQTHPATLSLDSEITNMSQVERVPDYGKVNIKRLKKMLNEIDSLKVSEFMNRSVAEKRRGQLINIALNDINGKVIIID